MNLFDIVIPLGPNDENVINNQLKYTKKNIIGYRNIYIISHNPNVKFEGCITISESIFPFSKKTVEELHGKTDRNGWYLQQLLKLYAGFVIDGILDRYLVIDSDTFFLKPTTFINEDGKCMYNYGDEHHNDYFNHMKRLDKDFIKQISDKSGICHHMMFEKKYVKEIIDRVESKPQHNNYPFYVIFLSNVSEKCGSGASEYEIYFNYMIKEHFDNIIIRKLNFITVRNISYNNNYDYVSCHWYQRIL
jgi:hypothetical protein